MGSCVRERVWVSLVKEASDTGGIPSPRALSCGLGARCAGLSLRMFPIRGRKEEENVRDTQGAARPLRTPPGHVSARFSSISPPGLVFEHRQCTGDRERLRGRFIPTIITNWSRLFPHIKATSNNWTRRLNRSFVLMSPETHGAQIGEVARSAKGWHKTQRDPRAFFFLVKQTRPTDPGSAQQCGTAASKESR